MIAKRGYGFPVVCDIPCIVSGVYLWYFFLILPKKQCLNDHGRTVNLVPPVGVLALYGIMVLVVAIVLTYFF